ncbi:prefoldin subunit alpha [Candidatus Woesearchaeota archaeon]|nr:prefoldin subunit alpha [Candidatus Woesearchaeota archaeon]
MKDKKQLQEKYMQMQMIEQQMQQVQKQLKLLESQMQELNLTEQALDDIKTTKIGTEILVPMASGIFVKAELKDNKELAVNVGANTVVKKNIDEAKKLITDQLEEITNMQQELNINLEKLSLSAQSLEKELTKLIQ